MSTIVLNLVIFTRVLVIVLSGLLQVYGLFGNTFRFLVLPLMFFV